MFFSKKLSKYKNISHGFFNRNGGRSSGIYESLNCGLGSNDQKDKVKKNLETVRNKINKKAKEIFLVHQVHSNKFIFIDKHFKIKKTYTWNLLWASNIGKEVWRQSQNI